MNRSIKCQHNGPLSFSFKHPKLVPGGLIASLRALFEKRRRLHPTHGVVLSLRSASSSRSPRRRRPGASHTRACLPTILERRSDVDDVVVVVVVVVPFWGVWLFVTALRDDDLSSVASSSSVLSVVFVFVFVFFFFFFFFGISL